MTSVEINHTAIPADRPNALKVIAHLVSFVMQPLFVPMMAFALILFGFPTLFAGFSFKVKMNILVFIGLITLVIPVLTVLLLKRLGLIPSVLMHERKDRFVPMMLTSGIYMALAFLLVTRLHINPLFSTVMVSIACVTVAVTFITFFWKISAHSTSLGGLFSLLFLLNMHVDNELTFAIMLLLLIVIGIVMTARLYLQAHSVWQVLSGFILGFTLNILVVLRLFGEL
jgi:membrane-associated phospholipid phosphatase